MANSCSSLCPLRMLLTIASLLFFATRDAKHSFQNHESSQHSFGRLALPLVPKPRLLKLVSSLLRSLSCASRSRKKRLRSTKPRQHHTLANSFLGLDQGEASHPLCVWLAFLDLTVYTAFCFDRHRAAMRNLEMP